MNNFVKRGAGILAVVTVSIGFAADAMAQGLHGTRHPGSGPPLMGAPHERANRSLAPPAHHSPPFTRTGYSRASLPPPLPPGTAPMRANQTVAPPMGNRALSMCVTRQRANVAPPAPTGIAPTRANQTVMPPMGNPRRR